MKKNVLLNALTLLVITASLATGVQETYAQEYVTPPVTVSKEKVRINGKICYSHIVKEKQTLYSIAKAYQVSIEDIYAFNPSIKENGLKKNSIILIPCPEAQEKESAGQPAEETKKDAEVKKNTEARKEAEVKLEAKKDTDVRTEVLMEKDSVRKEAPKASETPKTPKKKKKTHTVKWYEDLDVIADKYGISVEELMKANNLTGRKLSKRQKLVIPEPGEFLLQDILTDKTEKGPTPAKDTVDVTDSAASEVSRPLFPIFRPKDDVKATLILPLRSTSENVSRNNMDFYSGVLMAVKELGESGISTELNVYDSYDSNHPIAAEDINDSDMIIGPVSSGDLSRLLDSDVDPKMVISPLDPRAEALARENRNFIQAPTPQTAIYDDLVDWIRTDMAAGDTLVLISEKGARTNEAINQIKQAADSSGLNFLPFSYSILEGRDIIEPLTRLMTATGTNRVLIASDSEAFINDAIRNLNILIYNKLNVILYAPSRIRSFETIEVENLHNLSAHVSLGYHIDYEDEAVKNFLLKYRALFNTEPSQYAFQGYDIADYFIRMCSRYGNRWAERLDTDQTGMLQSTFACRRNDNGGYVNNGVRRIVYGKGWTIEKVR